MAMTLGSADALARLGVDRERLLRIDQWMARNERIGRISGSSLLLARRGEMVCCGVSGERSVTRSEPYTRDTLVRIYSMTKPVAAVALMQLVERGLLHLDLPISTFFPEFSTCHALIPGATRADQVEPVATPTIHHLLTHTAGLTYAFNPGLLAALYAEKEINFEPNSGGLHEMIARVAELPLAFAPGSSWEYSIGMDLIGAVVEQVSGKTLDAYIRDEITEPLGMIDTSFAVTPDKLDRFADCYVKTADDPLANWDSAQNSLFREGAVSTISGGGGLVSTLDDYLRFAEMLRLGGTLDGVRLLSARTVRFMRENHLAGEISSMGPASFAEMPMTGMGFGIGGASVLNVARTRMPGSVGDFGWGGIASTYFWIDPVEELSCIYFTQLVPSSSYPLRAELKALVHAALVD